MAYPYYQQTGQPAYGANQPLVFGPPPAPAFQPQSNWGGLDYYRAHAMNSDPLLFDHAWNRVREYGGAPAGGLGVGLNEARHWHRRAYGGLNGLEMMTPTEIGHAAAYEAYRTWIHNTSIYEPLSGDIERQREALTGLAVAEAERLMRYSGRPMDQYARLATSEAAAHTASYIFYQTRDDEYRSRSRYRTGGLDSDPYAYDDELGYPRARSQSRHRGRSRPRSAYGEPPMLGYTPSMSGMGSTYPPQPPVGYGAYPNTPMIHGSMPIHGSSYSAPLSAPSVYGQPMQMQVPVNGYPSTMPVAPPYGVPMSHSRSRSNSMNWPAPYGGNALSASSMGSGMSMGMPPTTQIVIHKSRKHHKHRQHSRHRRAHSSDPEYGYHSSNGY